MPANSRWDLIRGLKGQRMEYLTYTGMSQLEMGTCKAICPADTWTGFVYVDTTCLQLLSVHLSEIPLVVRYI